MIRRRRECSLGKTRATRVRRLSSWLMRSIAFDAQESASAPNDTPPDEKRKKSSSRAVRAPLPKNLPRQERSLPCPRASAPVPVRWEQKAHRLRMQRTPRHQTHRNLRRAHQAAKTCCARCKEAGVSTAPAPAAIVEKGVLAASLVVETIINKCLDHTPLYRQAVHLGHDAGVGISQSTLSSSVLRAEKAEPDHPPILSDSTPPE